MITRRQFGVISGSALASLVVGGACPSILGTRQTDDGRLTARLRAGAVTSAKGQSALGLDEARDAILRLPAGAAGAQFPLFVLFHGAGGSAQGALRRMGSALDEAGVAVLAPNSRGSTWDAIRSRFGPDVTFLNRALERVFDTVAVDPARIAIGGFSDGATYALSLGLINGDLFSHVLAFSPGFVVDGTPHGTPRIFISHGRADDILPIDRCGRRIAAELRKHGYDVTLREFDGGHEIPTDIARAGMQWFSLRKENGARGSGETGPGNSPRGCEV